MAEKALDSYLEIATKGKARVEKSGHAEPGLDSDEVMLQTVSAGVEMLCESGRRRETQKATTLAKTLEEWLAKFNSSLPVAEEFEKQGQPGEPTVSIPAQVLASVHKALGTSWVSWARLTYEAQERAKFQADAVEYFRQALRSDHAAEEDPTILYALALVLAETRDVEGAVAAVKQALASESRTFTEPIDSQSLVEDLKTRVTRTASLTECWHLLALLLSSRQEFETAELACQAALDQIESPRGHQNNPPLISELSFFDKQHCVEAKMTQMKLVEINDGAEVAVNAGSELVALYTKFFDNPAGRPPPTAKPVHPPPTATGTVKSFRSSFFNRNKENRPSGRNSTAAMSVRSRRLSEGTSRAPTISINDVNLPEEPANAAKAISRKHSGKLHKRASKRSIKHNRGASQAQDQVQGVKASPAKDSRLPERPPVEAPPIEIPVINAPMDENSVQDETIKSQIESIPEPSITSNGDLPNGGSDHPRPDTATSAVASSVGVAVSHDLRASVTAQFDSLSSTILPPPLEVKPASRLEHRPERDFFLRAPMTRKTPFFVPEPLFSQSDTHRFSLSLLQRIWLFIAALYRRAGMLEDARGAIDEAFKQAKLIEVAVSATKSPVGVKEFEEPAWGGVRSVEETWADAYAEMGNLCLAEDDPYEAMIKYEGALSHCVDHPAASVGLSNILLDMYAKKIPLQPKKPSALASADSASQDAVPPNESTLPVFSKLPLSQQHLDPSLPAANGEATRPHQTTPSDRIPHPNSDPWSGDDPEALDRLACRDRAYGLLSSLTKLGTGWADSEAWFALARAYEESGQVEKATEILWWVVELEEKKPVRDWSVLGVGYKLRH